MGQTKPDAVHTITSAGTSLSDEQRPRVRRYLISMAIRTACFVGAVLAPPPWRWILFAGALVLPYVAVVMANAGADRSGASGLRVFTRKGSGSIEGPRS